MSLGLKRGTVRLEPHDTAWDDVAREVISLLWNVLGGDAVDIQHVGSTAIPLIDAKPIIDIAVAVRQPEDLEGYDDMLEERGVIFRKTERDDDRFYVMGDAESRSCHIHMVPADGKKWRNYIAFRDYLNVNPDAAGRYCELKRELAGRYADDREAYTEGKAGLITYLLNEARTWKNAE